MLQVAELQKLDASVREQIMLSIQLAEKLVNSRISKQQYIDGDAGIHTKRDDLCQKMDVILASLWDTDVPSHPRCSHDSPDKHKHKITVDIVP